MTGVQTCALPICFPVTILRYGVIVFRHSDEGLQFLMIRRKDSFGYIDFIRGKYVCYNIEQIQQTIDEMSKYEKERLMNEPFEKLWKNLWGDCKMQYKGEEVASSKKFELIKNGIVINDEKITLEQLVKSSTTNWEETEWEFPKGRRNFQEKDIECALREFQEETGYSSKTLSVVENLLPFEETFIGSNHKCYKHKYYLAYMNDIEERDEDSLENYQRSEVSKLEWKTVGECLESIRPYNLEKKQLIININKDF